MKKEVDEGSVNTSRSKSNRLAFFNIIAQRVPVSGSVKHLPTHFLSDLKKHLGFTDEELSVLFSCSRPLITRSRLAAENATPRPAETPQEDMSSEEELESLKQQGKAMLKKLPENSPARINLLKFLIERSEQKVSAEAQEGKQLIVTLLNELTAAFNEAQGHVKAETEKSVRAAVDRFIAAVTNNPDKDPESIRAIVLRELEVPEVKDIVKPLFESKPHIMEEMNKYLAQRDENERPSLCGGGVVASPNSAKGGSFYKQKAREEERERLAKG